MSNRCTALIMAFLIPLIFTVIGPFSVNDLAGWIAHGEYFLDHHKLLREDIFSVLPTAPLVYPTWAVSILYALLYRATDLVGVCIFHSGVLVTVLYLVYSRSLFLLSDPARFSARIATYVFWLGGAATFGERPSAFALIIFLLSFYEIEKISAVRDIQLKTLLKLCILNIAWVNIHGSFALLWLMFTWKTTLLAISERNSTADRRNLLSIAAVHVCIGLSTLINPFTSDVFSFVVETILRSKERSFSEWAPTTLSAHFPTGLLYWLIATSAVVVLIRRRNRQDFWKFASSPFFFLLLNGLSAIRNAALPLLVLLPTLVQHGFIKNTDSDVRGFRSRTHNLFKVGFFTALLILATPFVKPLIARFLPEHRRSLFDNSAAFEISAAIQNTGRTCPIFNSWDIGSFLLLKLPNKIFVDVRNIIYSADSIREYELARNAGFGWEAYLNRYNACFAVLNLNAEHQLIAKLRTHKDWTLVTEEAGNVLFEKVRQ